ncbi:efflux transporter outer membrane subunit [Asticcacaulis taihuensis]|uniref:Efflux transporter, outer membrane factor (OMF) lipoprotein, NodT family n=1 Tax=Asticcacaulis taihuensis TaxID=260084 RepID=A0A1G4Q0I7_9CAUL|nr:efflux transporter outer membrane subunit [Asticcacaulis taihuensis]SCW37689.1 efflux transporter, outer membrane factor (OMF) lipoprotein, NodT family [Asticcacaulis taihuensis]
MKPVLLLVVACIALTACAGPRPEAPVNAQVTPSGSWREVTATPAPTDREWWRAFNDPVLDRLVETALANNSDLAIAAARVAEARYGYQAAEGALLPSLNASGAGAYSRSISAVTGRPVTQTAGEADLPLSYEADLFGRLRNTSKAAYATLQASQYGHEAARLSVAGATASGYITLRALDARLALLQETLTTREQALAAARHRADTGYSPKLELQQAQAEYSAAQQLIPAVELAIRRQEDALSILLGDNPRVIERGAALTDLAVPVAPVSLPADLLRQRPDVAQAEAQIVAADRSLDVARAAFMPTIRLTASGGYATSDLLPHGYDVFSLGGNIVQPLFQGGRLKAQAGAAASRRDQAAFAYKKAALNAFREVEDSLAAVDRIHAQQLILTDQTASLAEVYRLAGNRYRAGYSPYLEQIDAQRALLGAQLNLIQAQADHLNAIVGLYQAVGGGVVSNP